MRQPHERVKALFALITGQRLGSHVLVLGRDDVLRSAEILFHHLQPTDEQIGAMLTEKFGEILELRQEER